MACLCAAIGACGEGSDSYSGGQMQQPDGIGAAATGGAVAGMAGQPGTTGGSGGAAGQQDPGLAAGSMAGIGMAGTGMAGTGMAGTTGGAPPASSQPDAGMPAGDAGVNEPMASSDASLGGDASDDPMPREDLGEGDGSDVITIGDSWMLSGFGGIGNGIQTSLLDISGQPYRVYGQGATRLLNENIPDQYATARSEDPEILTVVMTGGGNDIIQVPGLREDCDAGGEQCGETVGAILDRLSSLWAEMAEDGVMDVIYVQYTNPEGDNVDFSLPDGDGVPARCEAVPEPLRCHRLETLDIVMGDIPDGIHPSAAAYDRIGQAVYDMMVERGMRR